jgi:hypothetical protein
MLPDHILDAMRKRVRTEIPGDGGFWTHQALEAYEHEALQLLDAGFNDDDIINRPRTLYWAAAGEYGA